MGCPPVIPSDFDRDGNDAAPFVGCAAGPDMRMQPGCLDKDVDGDNDGELADFAAVQRCFSGEDNPADPNCND